MIETAPESTVTSPRQHWALAILCLLRERPMHPYEMRRLMKLRHKDDRLVLKPGSLYNAVAFLLEQRLIEEVETNRQGGRPNRTIYRITPTGEIQVTEWIGRMLMEIRRDVSSFAVALDHLVHLAPQEAADALEERREKLAGAIAGMEAAIETLTPQITRINLIELEHDLILCRAQRDWLTGVIADLRSGALDWDLRKILRASREAAASPPAT